AHALAVDLDVINEVGTGIHKMTWLRLCDLVDESDGPYTHMDGGLSTKKTTNLAKNRHKLTKGQKIRYRMSYLRK
ncbi:hypothetical protein, partial [Pseudomonas viridiflava]|uniref:hypothetical protein n=1 Tax=Pseudomonas viridiflava TaxID=33069 RepID=UPI0019D1AEF4